MFLVSHIGHALLTTQYSPPAVENVECVGGKCPLFGVQMYFSYLSNHISNPVYVYALLPLLSRKWLKKVECVGGGEGEGGGGGGGEGDGGEDPEGLKLILPSRILITHSFHCSQGKYKDGKNKYQQTNTNTNTDTKKQKNKKINKQSRFEESNQNVGMGWISLTNLTYGDKKPSRPLTFLCSVYNQAAKTIEVCESQFIRCSYLNCLKTH